MRSKLGPNGGASSSSVWCCSHAGAPAILLLSVSTMATGSVLGVVLTIVGIAKIVQAFETKQWPGFIWQLLAITLLIAIIFIVLGILQIGWP